VGLDALIQSKYYQILTVYTKNMGKKRLSAVAQLSRKVLQTGAPVLQNFRCFTSVSPLFHSGLKQINN